MVLTLEVDVRAKRLFSWCRLKSTQLLTIFFSQFMAEMNCPAKGLEMFQEQSNCFQKQRGLP